MVLSPEYADLYEWQKKTYEHLDHRQMLQKLKISAYNCKIVYQEQFVVTNRTKLVKRKTVNRMYRTSTTWKYPPQISRNVVLDNDDNTPDRKFYFMIVATPIFGGVEDSRGDMVGYDLGMDLSIEEKRVEEHRLRTGSVVSDRFEVIVVKPKGEEDEEEETAGPIAGPSRVTRSMSASQAAPSEPAPRDEAQFPNLDNENEETQNMVRAIELNCQITRVEADRHKAEQGEVRKTPKPPKPVKPVKLETNEYGWAYNNTIMIRPTFEVFWYNLPRKRGLRL